MLENCNSAVEFHRMLKQVWQDFYDYGEVEEDIQIPIVWKNCNGNWAEKQIHEAIDRKIEKERIKKLFNS